MAVKIAAQGSDLQGGDAPTRPFKAQLADESVQKPPGSKKVPRSEVIG